MTPDRLFISEQVTYRLSHLEEDSREVERLLNGEPLSDWYRERMIKVAETLLRAAGRPQKAKEAA